MPTKLVAPRIHDGKAEGFPDYMLTKPRQRGGRRDGVPPRRGRACPGAPPGGGARGGAPPPGGAAGGGGGPRAGAESD